MSSEKEQEMTLGGEEEDTSVPMLQTGERIDSGTLANQDEIPVAETVETNPFGRLGGQSVRLNVSRANADHFFASVILFPNGLKKDAEQEVHAYMLPASLLQPYRAKIDARIEEVGDYTAVAVVAPSCRTVGYMLISIKAPDQITAPPIYEDNCFTKYPCLGCLTCCACCLGCPLVCLGCCVFGWVVRCCPCSLQCFNCACSCCCPGTLIVNSGLAHDIMKHMKENGGEQQFRADARLSELGAALAASGATPAMASVSDGTHSGAPVASNALPISHSRSSAMD